ncbi:MAG: DUF3987 domain-containing protein [Isosphaeraceae bacterium]
MSGVHEPVERLLHALAQAGFDPRAAGPGCWESRCPAHQGSRHNLSIRRGDDGRVLVHCHHLAQSGQPTCSPQDILGAIGLQLADLFPQSPPQPSRKPPRKYGSIRAALDFLASRMVPSPVAQSVWTYHDAAGEPLMAVGRFDSPDGSKTYRPLHRLADCSWVLGDPPGPLPLYRLDKVRAADSVVVVEGEKCAEAVRRTGYEATTSAHGAAAAAKTDWAPLAGKLVAILPDNDDPGLGYAWSVLRLLKQLDPRPRVKVIHLPDLAAGEDFVDWADRLLSDAGPGDPGKTLQIELQRLWDDCPFANWDEIGSECSQFGTPNAECGMADGQCQTADDRCQATALHAQFHMPSSALEECPVPRSDDWPEPPGEAAFHGIAGEIVRGIAPTTEADPAAFLLQLLTALGSVIGRGVWVEADGHRHHPNEFLCCVGDTSRARKGTSWKRLKPILALAEPVWAQSRIASGLSSGEGLVWSIRDAIFAFSSKADGQVMIDPGVDDKRLLVMESEMGNVLRVLQREGNTLSAVLRLAWDGDDLRTLTKNSPAQATSPHVSLIGHITHEELSRYLSAVEVFNGLGNRLLWACVRRANVLPFSGAVDTVWVDTVAARLGQAVRRATDLGPMPWSESGRQTWTDEYSRLTADRPGLWGAITSRAEAHVLRLALIYTLLDMARAIEPAHLHAALAVWGFCDRSAARLFGSAVGDRDADMILSALRVRPGGMTRKEISVDIFQRNRPATAIERALALLLKYHLVRSEPAADGSAQLWFALNT